MNYILDVQLYYSFFNTFEGHNRYVNKENMPVKFKSNPDLLTQASSNIYREQYLILKLLIVGLWMSRLLLPIELTCDHNG